MLAVHIGEEVGVGRQRVLLLIVAPGIDARAGRRDELEYSLVLGEGLAIRPNEAHLGPAARLQPNHETLAGLPASDVDRRAPFVSGFEDKDAGGLLGTQAVELEMAVLDFDLVPAEPGGVVRLDAQGRDDGSIGDLLAVGPLDLPLDRHAGSQGRGHFARRVAGLDLVWDDSVDAAAPSAGPIAFERVEAESRGIRPG